MNTRNATNPFADRLQAFAARLRRRGIAAAIVNNEANLNGLIGFPSRAARNPSP